MVGTLIKTMPQDKLYIGLVYEWYYCDEVDQVTIEVRWNDCDDTTELFREYEDYDSSIYHFYDNGRWWRIDTNFYMFKQLLERK